MVGESIVKPSKTHRMKEPFGPREK